MTIHPTSQEQIGAVQAMERALTGLQLAFGDTFPEVADRLLAAAKERYGLQERRDFGEMSRGAP
jgi:hypothetical protein